MATSRAESKFYWYLSLFIFALNLSSAFGADLNPSHFSENRGERFYLLSDETFSSTQDAKIRLEAGVYMSQDNDGVDIRLYKIPNPISFLEKQKNIHRPSVKDQYRGEGIRNAVHFVWDSLYKKSRLVWQRLISFTVRDKAVKASPDFKQYPAHKYNTKLEKNPQFDFLPGLEVVQTFRYPVHHAAPIQHKDVKLAGSSSHFLKPEGSPGTVYIPLGKLAPGLYLVEGILGSFRAVSLVFVSDTVAVTKISSGELLAWTAHRQTGAVAPGTSIHITDGIGRLGSGKTDSSGVYVLKKNDLDRTYVFGEDTEGGVFVSENFYYDSEIYSQKVYVVTDRPLYRPGEEVHFRAIGREFKDSLRSVSLPPGNVNFKVVDPSGIVIWKKALKMENDGLSGSFSLPPGAISGGYEMNISYLGMEHTSYIRVANFVKPHFEVEITMDEKNAQIGEVIKGVAVIKYPNGEPVEDAEVEVVVRRQQLSMVEGELHGLEQFPVELETSELKSDDDGKVELKIPAMERASRLTIQVKVTDKNSYRVTKTKEIIVSSEFGIFSLSGPLEFTRPGQKASFAVGTGASSKAPDFSGLTWELLRLEDQTKVSGKLNSKNFDITIPKSGHYVLNLRDSKNYLLATKSHFVEGDGIGTVPGTIIIMLDKELYQPGETAQFIINFSEEVSEALLTLERDKVESWSLATATKGWVSLEKTGPKNWRGKIKIEDLFAPNLTFSIAYVKNGRFVFENKGIKVEVPKIEITYAFDKDKYAPGELVQGEVTTTFKGRAVASEVTLSVVDEMIYALQPEVAPPIFDFFYHYRRNQVKTTASLSFHSFDAAVSAVKFTDSENSSYQQRNIKALKDRARREDKDTAYWNPGLQTDSSGKAKFSFKMPDSITKWRVTGRAIAGNWNVGQRVDYINSHKDFYHTFVGPRSYRMGDKPQINYIIFNHTGVDQEIELDLGAVGKEKVKVGRQPSYVKLNWEALKTTELPSSLKKNSAPVDSLITKLSVETKAWESDFVLGAEESFPADATEIRAHPYQSKADKVMSVVEYLWDYPYGCVEQVSSKLLSLSLAYQALEKSSASDPFLVQMQRRIYEGRSRLVRMASEGAKFSWWGDQTQGDLLLKVYAFYADYHASRALGITLPGAHWESLLTAYKDDSEALGFASKTFVLWMMGEMGLPVKTLLEGVLENIPKAPNPVNYVEQSLLLGHQEDNFGWSAGVVLLSHQLPGKVNTALLAEAKETIMKSSYDLDKAILALSDKAYREQNLNGILENVAEYTEATIDRSLTLALLWDTFEIGRPGNAAPVLSEGWVKNTTSLGFPFWTFPAGQIPKSLNHKELRYSYKSAKNQKSSIPMKIERTYHELIYHPAKGEVEEGESRDPEDEAWYEVGGVVKGSELKSSELYVDKITLTLTKEQVHTLSVTEVPLITGMELETQTWGINLKEGKDEITLGSALPGPRENFYVIPVDILSGEKTFYNLIRPGVSGKFLLPPVRYHRMYSPSSMAFEGESKIDFKNVSVL